MSLMCPQNERRLCALSPSSSSSRSPLAHVPLLYTHTIPMHYPKQVALQICKSIQQFPFCGNLVPPRLPLMNA